MLGIVTRWGLFAGWLFGIGAFAAEGPMVRTFRPAPSGGEGGYVQYDVPGLSGVSQIAVGDRFACALSKGTVHCWGQNGRGQLGRGFSDPRYVRPKFHAPAPALVRAPVTRLVASLHQVCAQLADGGNLCWGDASDAFFLGAPEAGKPGAPAISTPTLVPGFDGTVSLHPNWACAVSNGKVACRGRVPWSATSFDSRLPRMTPVPVPGLSDAREVRVLDRDFAVALRPGGLFWLGGVSPGFLGEELTNVGEGGTLGSLAGTDDVVKWLGGPCFAKADGGIRCVEHGSNPVEGLTDVTQYVAGELFGCELRRSGRVTCHGSSHHGALGPRGGSFAIDPVDVGLPDVRALASTALSVCALDGKARVSCWGAGFGATPKPLWSGAASLASGEDHVCMIGTAGTVRCAYGVRETPAPSPAEAVSARFLDEQRFVVGWKHRYPWAEIWNQRKEAPEARLELCDAPRGFDVSPDGGWLAASGCRPGTTNDAHVLEVWSTADWDQVQVKPMWGGACVPRGSNGPRDSTPIAFAPDPAGAVWFEGVADLPGKERDRKLCLFDLGKSALVKALPLGTSAARLYPGKDGGSVVVQGVSGVISLADSEPPERARSCVLSATSGKVTAWIPGRAFVSHDGAWFLLDGERFQTSQPGTPVWRGPSDRDECKRATAIISDDDSKILYACFVERVQVLDAATGAVLSTLERKDLVDPLAISPSGKTVLLSGTGEDVLVWSLESGKVKRLRAAKAPPAVPD